MFVTMLADIDTSATVLHIKFYAAFLPLSLTIILLSATPVDKARVDTLAWVFVFLFAGLTMMFGIFMPFMITQMNWSGLFLTPGFIATTQGFVRTLLCVEGCCVVEGKLCCTGRGCCWNPKQMPTREKLHRLWGALRTWSIINGVLLIFVCISNHKLPGGFTDPMNAFMWSMMSSWMAMALLPTPRNRGKLHHWLGQLGQSNSEEQEAAMVAALIGGTDPATAYTVAIKKFRGLNVSEVQLDDLDSSKDTGMHARTQRQSLGEVDAFVSHSWADDGSDKHKMLTEWGGALKEETGNEPVIWLDKACIDQANIEENLLALPVYLSGCKNLLVLNGPSYSSRLWCVMELFTFLKMGGSRDRIVLKRPDQMQGTKKNLLEGFDAKRAKCYLPEDRQRLLGVIEAGCGSLDAFNIIVNKNMGEGGNDVMSRLSRRFTFKKSKSEADNVHV